jgi:hypothetical protein
MLFSNWFPRRKRPIGEGCPQNPGLLPPGKLVDDWIGPKDFGHSFPIRPQASAGPATWLEVSAPEIVEAGKAFEAVVEARNGRNQLAASFTGTVQFGLGTKDADAVLPPACAFTSRDQGRRSFPMTLNALGPQTLTVTERSGSLMGQTSVIVESLGPITHFGVFALGRALAGFATPVLVVALDASNRVITDYAGTIHLACTDREAVLPREYTFAAWEKGSHLFMMTFAAAGRHALTVTDAAQEAIADRIQVRVITQLLQNASQGGWVDGWWA